MKILLGPVPAWFASIYEKATFVLLVLMMVFGGSWASTKTPSRLVHALFLILCAAAAFVFFFY